MALGVPLMGCRTILIDEIGNIRNNTVGTEGNVCDVCGLSNGNETI